MGVRRRWRCAALGVNRFFLAALSAALPHVVAGDRLVTANAVSTTSGTVATATGAGAGLLARFLGRQRRRGGRRDRGRRGRGVPAAPP